MFLWEVVPGLVRFLVLAAGGRVFRQAECPVAEENIGASAFYRPQYLYFLWKELRIFENDISHN